MEIKPKLKFLQCASVVFLTAMFGPSSFGEAVVDRTPSNTNVTWNVPVKFTPPVVPIKPILANSNTQSVAVRISVGSNVLWKDPIIFTPPIAPIKPVLADTNIQNTAVALKTPPDTNVTWNSPTNWMPPLLPRLPVYSNGQFQVHVTGAAGQSVVLQTSSDLIHWAPLSTNILAGIPISLIDTNAGNYTARFYRTVALP